MNRPPNRYVPALVVALLSMLASGTARADDEALLRSGVELRRQGRNAEALAVFQEANGERPTPRAQAQIGLAHHALGQWVEAEIALEHALAIDTDAWIA